MTASGNFSHFLQNPHLYELSDKEIEYTDKFRYNMLKDKNIIFEISIGNNPIEIEAYLKSSSFIIYNFGSEKIRKGYGRLSLTWIKNQLPYDMKLYVVDITVAAFPFWLKMYDEEIISDILFTDFTITNIIKSNYVKNMDHTFVLISKLWELYQNYNHKNQWLNYINKHGVS